MNSKLSMAIASILGGVSFGATAADQASSGTVVNSDVLQEITVTATRRSEWLKALSSLPESRETSISTISFFR